MSTEVTARVALQRGLQFVGQNDDGLTITLDAAPPAGTGSGLTPMQLVLISLASCSAMDVAAILRKKRQTVEDLEVNIRGTKTATHPTVFTSIWMEYVVHGDVDPDAVKRAIEMARDHYCPVWAMLSPTVEIGYSFRVTSEEPALASV